MRFAVCTAKEAFPLGGIRDIRGSLKRLEIGGILGMGELLQIMSLLETAGKIRQYGQREADDTSRDSLDESFEFWIRFRPWLLRSAAAFWLTMRWLMMPALHFYRFADPCAR